MLSRLREWLRPKIVFDTSMFPPLGKGDVLVLTAPSPLSKQQVADLRTAFGWAYAGSEVKCLVLCGGYRLELQHGPPVGD